MASTYTTDINIELIGTGEQAGSWGSTTNQNWQRVDEAITAYAAVPIDKDDEEYTWTLANTTDAFTDALVDPGSPGSSGRAAFVEFTNSGGGTNLDCAITIESVPGTSPRRVFYARNSLVGGDITFDVGGNEAAEKFILVNGATALIYTKLLGAGENEVHNGLGTVQVEGAVLGTGGADATITTNGAGDLILSTNDTLTNSSKITIQDTTSGDILLTPSTSGKVKVDDLNFDGTTISTTAGTDLNITPLPGQQIVLDGTIVIDAGVVTDATSITSTEFVGDLTGAASEVTVADESSGTTCFPLFSTAVSGDVEPKTGTNLTFNSANGTLGATLLTGDLTGDVTGDVTGDLTGTASIASTVATADTTDSSCSVALFESATGNQAAKTDGGLSYNATSGMLTATGLTGPLTGNVTGDVTGNAGTVTAIDRSSYLLPQYVLCGNTAALGSHGSMVVGTETSLKYLADTDTLYAVNFSGELSGTLTDATKDTITRTGTVQTGAWQSEIPSTYSGSNSICIGTSTPRTVVHGTLDPICIGAAQGSLQAAGEDYTGSGHSLIAIGSGSFSNNTSGNGNTGVGFNNHGDAKDPLTGDVNTYIGWNALAAIDGGADANTCVGAYSGEDINGSSNNNTCLGHKSGWNITTGYFNTTVGSKSGKGITTGIMNLCVGGDNGDVIGDGNHNVIVGRRSGIALIDTDQNTIVGNSTAQSVTNGVNNTVVGFKAGNLLVADCNHNTLIGTLAGGTTGGTSTTGSEFNTFIGYDLDFSASGVDYEIQIGRAISNGRGAETVTIGRETNTVTCDLTGSGTATWTHPSDSRFKKNIKPTSVGLSFINDLNPVEYEFRQPEDLDGSESDTLRGYIVDSDGEAARPVGRQYGFIAQEVKSTIDSHSDDGFLGWSKGSDDMQTLGEGAFVMPLVKAVQELSEKVASLEARLAAAE
jgi:hypothetical protein